MTFPDTTFTTGTTITSNWLNAVNDACVNTQDYVSVKSFGAVGDGVTDDTAAIQNAIDYAYTSGSQLEWPTGNYLTTSSITNFHNVTHTGNGVVVRSTDNFYISPLSTQTNNIYVSTSGLSTNDGLSASQPISTLQIAIDLLSNYGPILTGTWVLNLAAGTYARGRFPDNGLSSENPIEISGPDVGGHPNVPTAIISEGANGVSAEAIKISQGTQVQCSNLHFIGFNGTVSSGGFTSGGYCKMYTINCHFTNCTWGITCGQHSFLDVKGGIFDGCGFNSSGVAYSAGGGIRGLFLTKFSVGTQSAGSLTNGPEFNNNNFGVYAQEHIDGHLDWCTFDNNNYHLRLNYYSRLNLDGSSFKNAAGAAIWAAETSNVALSSNSTFGTGADANYINVIANTGSVNNPSQMTDGLAGYATSERCIYRSILNQVVNSTSITLLYEIPLKAQLWRDGASSVSGMKKIRFKMYGTLTGTAGYKRPQMRFGSTQTNVTFTATETGAFEAEGYVLIGTNPIGTQSTFFKGLCHDNGVRATVGTTSEVMTSDTNFRVEALVQNVADSITINGLEVYVDGL